MDQAAGAVRDRAPHPRRDLGIDRGERAGGAVRAADLDRLDRHSPRRELRNRLALRDRRAVGRLRREVPPSGGIRDAASGLFRRDHEVDQAPVATPCEMERRELAVGARRRQHDLGSHKIARAAAREDLALDVRDLRRERGLEPAGLAGPQQRLAQRLDRAVGGGRGGAGCRRR
ncbi:MAG: hypothetical protein K0S35_3905 [Geminicoccaceae bacterium]|nr:hypothetical protein [Geminicoccaceae bacterium]